MENLEDFENILEQGGLALRDHIDSSYVLV